jgi:hypothetical protein
MLVDKQFLLEEDGDGESLYEITKVRYLNRHWEYLVRFQGCSDCVNVPSREMTEILKRSSLVEI